MIMESLFDRGSVSVLQRMMAFTEERHQVLANNIANFDTVNYQMKDLPVQEFSEALNGAIERRDKRGSSAEFFVKNTRYVRWNRAGEIQVRPTNIENNILFHDKNNRFVEKQMSEMAKNSMKHTLVADMLRQQYDLMRTAIRGRL